MFLRSFQLASKKNDPHARSSVASTHVSHQPSASRAHLCFTLMFICLGLHTFSHADPKHLNNMQVGGGVLGIVSFLVICKSIYWILESYKWSVEFTGLINTTHFYIIFTHFQTIPFIESTKWFGNLYPSVCLKGVEALLK